MDQPLFCLKLGFLGKWHECWNSSLDKSGWIKNLVFLNNVYLEGFLFLVLEKLWKTIALASSPSCGQRFPQPREPSFAIPMNREAASENSKAKVWSRSYWASGPPRQFPNASCQTKISKPRIQCEHSQATRSQTNRSKRNIRSEHGQTKDPKRKLPSESSPAKVIQRMPPPARKVQTKVPTRRFPSDSVKHARSLARDPKRTLPRETTLDDVSSERSKATFARRSTSSERSETRDGQNK